MGLVRPVLDRNSKSKACRRIAKSPSTCESYCKIKVKLRDTIFKRATVYWSLFSTTTGRRKKEISLWHNSSTNNEISEIIN